MRIRQRKTKNSNSIILLLGLFFSKICLFSACDSQYSKKNHINTLLISNQVYYEIFEINSGSISTSGTYSHYLTDSISFRKHVGTIYYDDEDLYCKSLDSNRVMVYKVKRTNNTVPIEKKIYTLDSLQKAGEFD